MNTKRFSKGKIIFKEGEPGDEMYVIMKGKAKVYKTIDKKKVSLGLLGPDDFIGEMSLFLPVRRTATVEALQDTEVITCDKSSFISMIREDPDIAVKIVTILTKRLVDAHHVIVRLEGEKKSLKPMYGKKK